MSLSRSKEWFHMKFFYCPKSWGRSFQKRMSVSDNKGHITKVYSIKGCELVNLKISVGSSNRIGLFTNRMYTTESYWRIPEKGALFFPASGVIGER